MLFRSRKAQNLQNVKKSSTARRFQPSTRLFQTSLRTRSHRRGTVAQDPSRSQRGHTPRLRGGLRPSRFEWPDRRQTTPGTASPYGQGDGWQPGERARRRWHREVRRRSIPNGEDPNQASSGPAGTADLRRDARPAGRPAAGAVPGQPAGGRAPWKWTRSSALKNRWPSAISSLSLGWSSGSTPLTRLATSGWCSSM